MYLYLRCNSQREIGEAIAGFSVAIRGVNGSKEPVGEESSLDSITNGHNVDDLQQKSNVCERRTNSQRLKKLQCKYTAANMSAVFNGHLLGCAVQGETPDIGGDEVDVAGRHGNVARVGVG